MKLIVSLPIVYLIIASSAFAQRKETVELQRDIALLQDQVRSMQRSMDEKLWLRLNTLLDVADALMKNLPDQTAYPMSNRPDGRLIAKPREQTPEDGLEVGTIAPDSSMCNLVKYPAHISVAFCRAAAMVLLGTLVLAGTGPHP